MYRQISNIVSTTNEPLARTCEDLKQHVRSDAVAKASPRLTPARPSLPQEATGGAAAGTEPLPTSTVTQPTTPAPAQHRRRTTFVNAGATTDMAPSYLTGWGRYCLDNWLAASATLGLVCCLPFCGRLVVGFPVITELAVLIVVIVVNSHILHIYDQYFLVIGIYYTTNLAYLSLPMSHCHYFNGESYSGV